MPTTDFNYDDNSKPKVKRTSSRTPILDSFSRDLNKLAREGKIDPVIGRDVEVKRIIQILSRKKKNNVVVVGEPGVGKSAIVEKLALSIVNNDCPIALANKRIVSLDLTALIAGTKYRGQFEERIRAIIVELQDNPDVVLFIDELHTMIGAGNSSGSMDAANILKPALSRGEIQCIGATTFDEYQKHIEKDGALVRRFQKLILTEPNKDETNKILRNIRKTYETYHKVKYSDDVIETIVTLTERYMPEKQNPDKSIDVMDELGSSKKVSVQIPEIIEKLNKEIDEISIRKLDGVKNQDYETAAKLRDEEKLLKDQLETEKSNWENFRKNNFIPVSIDDVYDMISSMTTVPIQKLGVDEIDKLINLEKTLNKKVIGQENAISIISKAIRRNRVGIKNQNKPIGTFMFLGSTGVGKTHVAKCIAEEIFGSKDNIIRIDMSEFMEKHNVSRLVGSPPGYVGHDEGGQLTEKVKNNPFSVILFDEVEKAHKDVFNILLQILDEGHVTDSFGKKVNFKNTLIILTSNVGAKKAVEFGGGVGFTSSDDNNNEAVKSSIIQKSLKQQFNPEFLNRIDDIIMFNSLNVDTLKIITKNELNKLKERLIENGYKINFDDTIVDEIINRNNNLEYGARPIMRIIQNLCEDFISDEILSGKIKKNTQITLYFDKIMKKKKK